MSNRLLLDIGVRFVEGEPPCSLALLVMGMEGVALPLLDPQRSSWCARDLVVRRWPGVGGSALFRGKCGCNGRLFLLGQPRGVDGPRGRCYRCCRRHSSH